MFTKNIAALTISLGLLSGCQHSAEHKTTPPTAEHQLEQLSSLVGASQFLREKCSRADIPTNDKLAAAALNEANKKGWPSQDVNQTQLLDAAKGVFDRLNADATPLEQKCSSFNQSLARFLEHTR
ncbi:type II secretion system pilot lipoprotein GspS [Serratia plymuthica]|uniref:Pullulanase n=1 Tax=Serratia plymuthica S13 TaxID=1348660 RepID=S4YR85_SERPL|nr:type II secretion system pilot lipoprotein GspS [Serratia plymuthica]AGP46830.1 pullulanase [Serratia plymuthica S13]AHY06031.1 pullulanase [Serratia plymuthica]ANJ97414.1 pullulanase [Serratia plymuthica]EKF66020.1 lipoprotein, PulS/OutS family [Serratia plymuthica A30]KYG14702.1 Pullulanase secretion protein PulS precursor [Serratia plymuthica]